MRNVVKNSRNKLINDFKNNLIDDCFSPSLLMSENIGDVDFVKNHLLVFKDTDKITCENIGDLLHVINYYKLINGPFSRSIVRLYTIVIDDFIKYVIQNGCPRHMSENVSEYLDSIIF
jgi:hypothetical protein